MMGQLLWCQIIRITSFDRGVTANAGEQTPVPRIESGCMPGHERSCAWYRT